MAAEVDAVAPAVGQEIGRANGENDTFVAPGRQVRNHHLATIPSNFIAGCRAMIGARDLQRIAENTCGVIIIVARGIRFPPSGERFPAEWHNDLLTPVRRVGSEPLFIKATAHAIEAELPWSVEIEPVH